MRKMWRAMHVEALRRWAWQGRNSKGTRARRDSLHGGLVSSPVNSAPCPGRHHCLLERWRPISIEASQQQLAQLPGLPARHRKPVRRSQQQPQPGAGQGGAPFGLPALAALLWPWRCVARDGASSDLQLKERASSHDRAPAAAAAAAAAPRRSSPLITLPVYLSVPSECSCHKTHSSSSSSHGHSPAASVCGAGVHGGGGRRRLVGLVLRRRVLHQGRPQRAPGG